MKTKVWVVAAFVLTFAAGVLTGGILVWQYGQKERPWSRFGRELERHRPLHMEALKSLLNLSDAQSQQIAEILAKHQEQFRQHLDQMRPLSHQILKNMTAQIDSVLTPEQRQKFHQAFPPPPFGKMPSWKRRPLNDSLENGPPLFHKR